MLENMHGEQTLKIFVCTIYSIALQLMGVAINNSGHVQHFSSSYCKNSQNCLYIGVHEPKMDLWLVQVYSTLYCSNHIANMFA